MSADGQQPAHVALALLPGSDPIAGTLTGPDGLHRSFAGWLELVRAIEDVHAPSIAVVRKP